MDNEADCFELSLSDQYYCLNPTYDGFATKAMGSNLKIKVYNCSSSEKGDRLLFLHSGDGGGDVVTL